MDEAVVKERVSYKVRACSFLFPSAELTLHDLENFIQAKLLSRQLRACRLAVQLSLTDHGDYNHTVSSPQNFSQPGSNHHASPEFERLEGRVTTDGAIMKLIELQYA
jgi:hypothetical protein